MTEFLSTLSVDSLGIVLSYLDHVSLSKMSRTSRSMHMTVVLNSESLWESLATWRTIAPLSPPYCASFKQRHRQDRQLSVFVSEVAALTKALPDFDNARDFRGSRVEQLRLELCRDLGFIATECFDGLRDLAKKEACSIIGCAAAHVLDDFYASHVFLNEWGEFLAKDRDLESGVVLVSKSLVACEDLLKDNSYNIDMTMATLLDEIANLTRLKLPDSYTNEQAAETLAAVLKDASFSGNREDYYNVQNSNILSVLQHKTGIPLSLAVLYQLVLQRLNVASDVIGLPGHVVLGLTPTTFVDVFNDGKFLRLQDCRDIVDSYQVPWDQDFLMPMAPTSIITRLINNILHCLIVVESERATGERVEFTPERSAILRARFQSVQRALFIGNALSFSENMICLDSSLLGRYGQYC